MANIELVIKIDEERYKRICSLHDNMIFDCDDPYVAIGIKNGQILPKGHGRLIDADEVNDAIYKCFDGIQFYDGTGYDIYSDSKESIDKIQPIIKADEKYEAKVITRGNCMICGKELTEGLFFCKECEEKANSRQE